MGNRSTSSEVENRVSEVCVLLLEGKTRTQILKKCAKWKTTNRQIDSYIAEAKAEIREINEITREDALAFVSSNLVDIYLRAKLDGNIGEARKILMDFAKVKGLEQTTINHTINNRPLKDMSDVELLNKLDESNDE